LDVDTLALLDGPQCARRVMVSMTPPAWSGALARDKRRQPGRRWSEPPWRASAVRYPGRVHGLLLLTGPRWPV